MLLQKQKKLKKRVKIRKKIKPLGFVILFILIILVVGMFSVALNASKSKDAELGLFKDMGKVPKLQSFDLVMVGDALIHYGDLL